MDRWSSGPRSSSPPPEQPFFLAAGIYRPHLPWYAPSQYFDMYPPDDITPPLIKKGDLDDVPAAGRAIAEQRRGDLELVRRAGQYQRILQAYLASVTSCDVKVGRLLDALDASPAAKNTIIVLWSDNGWHFGEKEHLHKMTLWARATRLPLVIAAPGVTKENTRTSRPASFIDLFPTLNELCGLPQLEELEGTSLVPLLEDPNRVWERPALVTYLQGNHAVCSDDRQYSFHVDGRGFGLQESVSTAPVIIEGNPPDIRGRGIASSTTQASGEIAKGGGPFSAT
jgi:arylsulfatase A-like enzyme